MKEKEQGIRAELYVGIALSALAIVILIVLWYSIDVFLLVFAGILLAIFLRSISDVLRKKLKIADVWAVSLTLLLLVSVLTLLVVVLVPTTSLQIEQLIKQLPQAWQHMTQNISSYLQWKPVSSFAPYLADMMPKSQNILVKVTNLFSTTFGVIGNFIVFLFIGIFLAYDPEIYRNGLLKLVPMKKRARMKAVMSKVAETLQWWLLGKLLSMAFIGLLTSLGLWLLGVPLAITLGLIAAFLTFIPNFGPFIAAMPALLIAASQNLDTALYVVLLYAGIQTVESYLITPKIQQETIALPPALAIFVQILMMVLLGGLGLALATPLAAALIVLVRMLYVEDVLHDHGKKA